MKTLCIMLAILAAGSIAVAIREIYILAHTTNLTDFLCIHDFHKKDVIINQRADIKGKARELQYKFSPLPIKEEIKEYNKLFRADFETLFDKLKPNVRYRVTTHYSDVVNKAAADGKIRLLEEPRFEKKRTLTEMKPLLGRRDYILAKRCIQHYPQLFRCCENCARKTKCACSRGGVCAVSFEKMFYTFVFEKLDTHD